MKESAGCIHPRHAGKFPRASFSAEEKKSARSLMVCFLALECGYWQMSQLKNWLNSVCMMPPEGGFSGGIICSRIDTLFALGGEVVYDNLTIRGR